MSIDKEQREEFKRKLTFNSISQAFSFVWKSQTFSIIEALPNLTNDQKLQLCVYLDYYFDQVYDTFDRDNDLEGDFLNYIEDNPTIKTNTIEEAKTVVAFFKKNIVLLHSVIFEKINGWLSTVNKGLYSVEYPNAGSFIKVFDIITGEKKNVNPLNVFTTDLVNIIPNVVPKILDDVYKKIKNNQCENIENTKSINKVLDKDLSSQFKSGVQKTLKGENNALAEIIFRFLSSSKLNWESNTIFPILTNKDINLMCIFNIIRGVIETNLSNLLVVDVNEKYNKMVDFVTDIDFNPSSLEGKYIRSLKPDSTSKQTDEIVLLVSNIVKELKASESEWNVSKKIKLKQNHVKVRVAREK